MITLDPTESEWEAARTVTEQISAIAPGTIAKTRQAYDELTLREKSLVQNYDNLLQAEADAFMLEIEKLGKITSADNEQVEALLSTYRQMPKSQQNRITNSYKLVNANQKLQMIARGFCITVTDDAGNETYYKTLEDALLAGKGTICLMDDVTADTVVLIPGMTLDLNGHVLTANLLVAMNGASVLDGGTECTGGGLLKIPRKSIALAEDNGNGVIPVWNGTDGYLFTRVTFQQVANSTGKSSAQYMFLPGFSNSKVATLLADGGLDNGLKIKVCLTWNDGKTQQFYTYSDEMLTKVFDGTGRWVFDLKITGIADIGDMVANPLAVADCGPEATARDTKIEGYDSFAQFQFTYGYRELIAS
jgi:hypothetical protein